MKLSSRWVTIGILAILALGSECAQAQGPGISPEQKQKLKSLAANTRSKSAAQHDVLRRARTDLRTAYRNYNLDEHKAKAALEKIGQAQLSLLNLHLDSQIGIRRIVSESQFKQFSQMTRRFGKGDHPGMGAFAGHAMERPIEREMLAGLGLSPDELRRANELLGPGPQFKGVLEKLQRDSGRMLDLYARYDINAAAARKLIGSIHAAQVELASLNYKRQQAMRSILSEDQFERLQEEIAKRMRAHERPRLRRAPRR